MHNPLVSSCEKIDLRPVNKNLPQVFPHKIHHKHTVRTVFLILVLSSISYSALKVELGVLKSTRGKLDLIIATAVLFTMTWLIITCKASDVHRKRHSKFSQPLKFLTAK